MNREEKLIKQWKKDEKAVFRGWDFSYIKRRYKQEEPKWNYVGIAKKLIKKSNSVLDIATGGGEIFSEILSIHKPKKIVSIEGYKPNVAVARNKLKKFKAKVIYADETKKLLFKDEMFDLVLNRHGGINKNSVNEIYRILKPRGVFLTQQVDSRNIKDLIKYFKKVPIWTNNTLGKVGKLLSNKGFKIKRKGFWEGKLIFKDVGAIVYFLKAIPWAVKGFSVDRNLNNLERLQKEIKKRGILEFKSKRFFILAEKNEP